MIEGLVGLFGIGRLEMVVAVSMCKWSGVKDY